MIVLVLARRKTELFRDEEFAPLLDAEAEAVRHLYERGIIREAYGRDDTPGAVLKLEVTDVEEAQRALGGLPLAERGMLELTIIPLRGYRGFGPRG